MVMRASHSLPGIDFPKYTRRCLKIVELFHTDPQIISVASRSMPRPVADAFGSQETRPVTPTTIRSASAGA